MNDKPQDDNLPASPAELVKLQHNLQQYLIRRDIERDDFDNAVRRLEVMIHGRAASRSAL